MFCPQCGHEMEEGHLICEVCGYEVQIVPVFEPEIEPQIDNKLVDAEAGSGIVNDPATTEELLESTDELLGLRSDDALSRGLLRRALTGTIIAVASILILIICIWALRRYSSLEYQLDKVRDQAAQGRYEDAISALENIYVTHPDASEILFMEADYYQELGKPDQAIDTLERIISSDRCDEADIFSAYDRLINIYASNEDYDTICKLISECEYPEIVQSYQNYLALKPVFSNEPGEYDSTLRLKISANTSGNIYYTLDGSVPNETSIKYDSPIALEPGRTDLSAIFVNQYGIASEVTSGTYIISDDLPPEPVINTDSGDYHVPVLIEVEVPEGCSVYYTTDRSVPTQDSVRYTDPIPMPVKYSNFSFITISEDGLESDVVIRSYSLTFPNGISLNRAVDILKARLIERGQIKDAEGHSDRAPGRYTYEVISAVPISGQGDYYTLREFYHDGTGSKTPTDTTYIVEIYNGSTAILGGSAGTGFIAIAF